MTNQTPEQAAKNKERPILFSGPMVRAILDGRKTQTRRVIKHQPTDGLNSLIAVVSEHVYYKCPFGQPGDWLWVRETIDGRWGCDAEYVADETRLVDSLGWDWTGEALKGGKLPSKVIPSIHMPRWASRITLEITNIRVERLNEISEVDAIAEGLKPYWKQTEDPKWVEPGSCIDAFKELWHSINGPGAWDANPWVWVVEFRKV